MVKGGVDADGFGRLSSPHRSDLVKFLEGEGFKLDRLYGWSNSETFQIATIQSGQGGWVALITPDGQEEAREFDRKMEGRYV